MAAITTFDGIVSRINSGYALKQPIYWEQTTTAILPGGNLMPMHWGGLTKSMPALPTGVSQYFVTRVNHLSSGTGSFLFGRAIALAQFNNATNTFTDVASMPTVTELGVSRTASSALLCVAAAATNSNAGSLTVTYVDQDGNTAEAAASFTMPNSAPVGSAWWLPLNSGDWGVQDITNITRSGGASHAGTINFYGMIPICLMCAPATTLPMTEDLLTNEFNMVYLPGSAGMLGFFLGTLAAKVGIGDITVVGDST